MRKVLNIIVLLFLSLTSVAQIDNLKTPDRGILSKVYLYDTICQDQVYDKYGFYIDNLPSGMVYDTLYFPENDSTVYLNLLVYELSDNLIYAQICEGSDYVENGFSFIQPIVGFYEDTIHLTNAHQCDSMVVLNLEVFPVYDTVYYDTICEGYDYTSYGFNVIQPSAGTAYDTVVNYTPANCEDVSYLVLTVKPRYDIYLIDSICEGDSYDNYGFLIEEPSVGILNQSLSLVASNGCDSIVHLELHVNPLKYTYLSDTICANHDYLEYGFVIINPPVGLVYDTLRRVSYSGCDSTVYMELTVMPNYYISFTDTICEGGDYTQHGFEILQAEAGIVYDTLFLESIYGCDSIVTLELHVNPVKHTYLTDTICEGNDYMENGFVIIDPQVGVVYDTLNNLTYLGCDSIVYLELTVAPTYDTVFIDTICDGSDYLEHGFVIVNPPLGVLYDTIFRMTTQGCDSTIYLELTVAPYYDTLFVDTICAGVPYTQHGFDILQMEEGDVYDTLFLQSIYGCDSIVYLELYVWKRYDLYFEDEICYGESYSQYGFNINKPDVGLVMDTLFLHTIHGCDSILYLELTVHPVFDVSLYDEICFGEDYVGWGFEFINPPVGLNHDTLYLHTVYGCDSIVSMALEVHPLYDTLIIDTICHGDNYTLFGFDLSRPPVGLTRDTLFLHSIYGCDSIIMLKLTVVPRLDFGDSEIFGNVNVFVQTDIQVGWYNYHIDSLEYWDEFRWEIVEEGNNWTLLPKGRDCDILVKSPGIYTLRVTAENYCDTTWIDLRLYSEFYDVDENEAVKANVYPNPANNTLIIESEGIIGTTVMGIYGQKVNVQKHLESDKVVLDVSELPHGMYLILVETRKGSVYKQILVER